MTCVAVLGAGAVGARVARRLLASDAVDRIVLRDIEPDRLASASRALGSRVVVEHAPFPGHLEADLVVVASPRGTQVEATAATIEAGRPAVLVGDGLAETVSVLRLANEAARAGVPVAVGSGFGPGLSCVLAVHAAAWFDEVTEVHVAKAGTGGPACALVHHRALSRRSYDWRGAPTGVAGEDEASSGGGWIRRPGGSGRELFWFPDPVGPRDCYRAALPDPVLLHHALPEVARITARMAATRRDRLTAPLPMLSPPHTEGGSGAIRVEVRGLRGTASDVLVLGATERPAVAAATVAATTAEWILSGRHRVCGMVGLGEMVEPVAFLDDLAVRGLEAQVFEGERALN
ncbi:MAG: Gfo/Idh/MocA family oxidoreductase [Actinomycetota bacterium]|nr:Gfo/Idh/MocA family oxidoreductase [Actinomycetota bacterium]